MSYKTILDNLVKNKHQTNGKFSQQEINLHFLNRIECLENKILIKEKSDCLPSDKLIQSLGEKHPESSYSIKVENGEWWIEHDQVGSGEPLKQWLTDKPLNQTK